MSTYTMASHLTFPASRERAEINIRRVSSVRIESSWKSFTSLAEITLPRNIRDFNREKFETLFKVGDPVIIRLGYGCDDDYKEGMLPVEFAGYLTNVSMSIPIVLRCEDEMYKLKRDTVTVSSPQITLKELLKKIAVGYEINCPDVKLGAVRYPNVAPIRILDDLKKNGLHSYFVGKVLHVSDGYTEKEINQTPINILLEKNAVSEDLNQSNTNENCLIQITSTQSNGRVVKTKYGEAGGDKMDIKTVGLTQIEIEVRAKQLYTKRKTQGFEGSITLFGIPRVQHGVKINLDSVIFPNMKGLYYVEQVEKTFDENGYRQKLGLGKQAI